MANVEVVRDLDTAVARILERTGASIVAAAPLALGKPMPLLNALYRRVKADEALDMVLFTALSLTRPRPKPGLEARFAKPFLDRQFGPDYPDAEYILDLKAGRMPSRVTLHEFYFQSGSLLGCAQAQRAYVSLNYTHVARAVAARGVNVTLQLVARKGDRISLSSNPDTVLDLLDELERTGRPRPFVVGVVHPDLPFLGNQAEVPLDLFDLIVEPEGPAHRLFALPREPVQIGEFALGLHAASLVRDGGSLQIGIGALSDALVYGLVLRHRHNADFRAAHEAVRGGDDPGICERIGGVAPLSAGLYGASEMVMDGFVHLRREGILTRRVFDDVRLQRALNEGRIGETVDAATLDRLIEAELVSAQLDWPSLDWLERFGFLPSDCALANGVLTLPDGVRIGADLVDPVNRHALSARIAGRRLRGGQYLHGGFYLGSNVLYDWLRGLAGEDYDGIGMTRISHINELYGGREMLEKAQRRDARFFNTCMMMTMSGAAVSDGLADGEIVSGVGGQYNFVAMAHALPGGRSALMLRATREGKAGVQSNIVWNYGHITIARHLRDLVVTEYGVADLFGASDEEIIQRLLAITDARFIDELAARAKAAGKLDPAFRIPDAWRRNTPAHLAQALAPFRLRGLFPVFPFGSDFNETELAILPALKRLKAATATRWGLVNAIAAALALHLRKGPPGEDQQRLLARLDLDAPTSLAERIEAMLVRWALQSP